ncbi:MAG: dTDP-4-dehydrorhamnose 3,5-epimerase [Planctomycetota bacterium]
MKVVETGLPGVLMLEPVVHGDDRGFFLEFYNEGTFREIGIEHHFVQDNHSSSERGVLRGLHYQIEHAQAKIVRVIAGKVFDVAVDIRRGSPAFGRWTGAVLSAKNRRMMFVPEGYAHGFYVLSRKAEFLYKCSDFYMPEFERGIIWNDPDIGIEWPIPDGEKPILSAKDRAYGKLLDAPPEDLPAYGGEGE